MSTFKHPILFYDGECGFCDFSVRTLLSIDSQEVFKIASLQSSLASFLLPQSVTQELNTLVIVSEDKKIYTRGQAFFYFFSRMKGPWKLISISGKILPAKITNRVYDWIAARRHNLFGKDLVCKIEDRDQFSKRMVR